MNADEYRAALTRLGLSINKAAPFLDCDHRTARRYASRKDSDVPGSVAGLLAFAIALKEDHGLSLEAIHALRPRVESAGEKRLNTTPFRPPVEE